MARLPLPQRVAAEVAAFADFSREDLADLWASRFGCVPPKGCGRKLLELSAAYGIQEKTLGGPKPESRKTQAPEMVPYGNDAASRRKKRRRVIAIIKPGTRLVREWNGRTHHVEMVEGGFVWNGKKHRSLSTIAREITGAHWSGPRFFGL